MTHLPLLVILFFRNLSCLSFLPTPSPALFGLQLDIGMTSNAATAGPSGRRGKRAKTADDKDQADGPPISGILLSSNASAMTGPLAAIPYEILVMIVQALLADDWEGGKVSLSSPQRYSLSDSV